MKFSVNETFVTDTLQRMVQIDSRNPSMTPDGPGEVEIGAYLAGILEDLGLRVRTHHLAPHRVNVVGVLPGSGGGRSLLLNGHMDTVGVEDMEDPFSGDIRQGRLYGRGSQDMKGSLAAMLGAVKALAGGEERMRGDVIFAAVADEEDRSLGTEDLLEHYQADAAIVTEPTDLEIVQAHRGLIWYAVKTFGRAAHGSRYREGVDAITHMGRFLALLGQLEKDLPRRSPHPLTGPPSLHASLIEGGTDICTYAAECEVKIDRRTLPGEGEAEVTSEIQDLIDRLEGAEDTFRAELRELVRRSPLETPADAEILEVIDHAFSSQLGRKAERSGAAYWSDAALLADAGMEAVLLGPVGYGMHGPEEWVDVASVHDLAWVLAETACLFCE